MKYWEVSLFFPNCEKDLMFLSYNLDLGNKRFFIYTAKTGCDYIVKLYISAFYYKTIDFRMLKTVVTSNSNLL